MLKELLSETGELSTMRVMSFVSLALGGAVAIIGLLKGKDLTSLALLSGVFVGAAFGGKVAQKSKEVSS
jgi:hypothetical protein